MKARTTDEQRRFEFRVGIAAIMVTVVALLVGVGAAVIPFGETVYRADFATSGDARIGDEVRVAGIPLGSVRKVMLVGDHVEVEFGLDSAVHLGEETAVHIKALTPIGGRYLDVKPAGAGDAAGKIIPRERNTTPFDLGSVFEESAPALMKLDGGKLRQSIAKLAGAFEEQPEALEKILQNVNELSAIAYARKQQLERSLKVSTEFFEVMLSKVDRLGRAGDQLVELYRDLSARREQIVTFASQIRRLFDHITIPVGLFHELIEPTLEQGYDSLDKAVVELLAHKDELDRFSTEIAPVLEWFSQHSENPYVTVDHSGATVTGTQLCPAGTPGC
ncbi:MlaD family protein [Antrihabitans sp. YC2-6]|uniref:MlaD family protein n=1 Tax=Antrihabitans sp. YC2-6 TaxID=2799498 RepID=UPI0018F57BC8|nr:MlaD family protein [Antrihabitans sp. YC2-6]MBJ8346718.1 MCE family protein [Antrihabitans sp. YC2-6]